MLRKALILTTLSTCALAATPMVLAQGKPQMPKPMSFEEADQNGNGTMTQDEFFQARAERLAQRSEQGYRMRMVSRAPDFDDLDLDGDGSVGPDEFEQAQSRRRQEMGERRMGGGMGRDKSGGSS